MLAASLHIFDGLGGGLAAEAHACLGVEFQTPDSAPAGELIRLDYGANDDMPLAFQLALSQLGALYKIGVGVGQLVRIRHDFEDARIVLALVPRHAEGANFHDDSPSGAPSSMVNDGAGSRKRAESAPARSSQSDTGRTA